MSNNLFIELERTRKRYYIATDRIAALETQLRERDKQIAKARMRSGEEWTPDGLHRPTLDRCALVVRKAASVDGYIAWQTAQSLAADIRALAEPQEKP